ncbi:hypothetical protein OS493_032476 [Desmophyllum pertusum]|uniref:Uncharacterized protein n=1 Tax=Desmophyllum pertusum TaxID=174260 RepID=A0A9W9ZK59_9CNID|nr:hypothetical protein OS493_032476 [Desmophyllum pertusum]
MMELPIINYDQKTGLCYRVVGLVDSRLGVPQPCHAITRASVSHFKGDCSSRQSNRNGSCSTETNLC